jgi:hypothetical protein
VWAADRWRRVDEYQVLLRPAEPFRGGDEQAEAGGIDEADIAQVDNDLVSVAVSDLPEDLADGRDGVAIESSMNRHNVLVRFTGDDDWQCGAGHRPLARVLVWKRWPASS